MKRFILSLTAAAVLSMPMAASALEKMDNNQLKSSTGQAGVSIAVDDVVIYQKSLADTTYWDTDGLGATGTAATSSENPYGVSKVGPAGIKIDHHDSMEKLTTIDAILNDTDYGVSKLQSTFADSYMALTGKRADGMKVNDKYDADTNPDVDEYIDDENNDGMQIGILNNSTFIGDENADDQTLPTGFNPADGSTGNLTNGISPLTIDVGTCKALTQGWMYNTGGTKSAYNAVKDESVSGPVAGVVIGLPTVEITTYSTNVKKTVSLELTDEASAMNKTHNTFLQIEKSGASQMAILGGRLEIAPH